MNPTTTNLAEEMCRSTSTTFTSCSSPNLANLSDSLLLKISRYLSPPEVYKLIQTCTRFNANSTELSIRHFLSHPQNVHDLNHQVTNLGRKLLQESMISGLPRVVPVKARGLLQFQAEESRKGRKVILAGSAVVQVITGKHFDDSNLNFFCTKDSLQGFRRLMKEYGYCCANVVPHYCDSVEFKYRHYFSQGLAHHVETFIPGVDVAKMTISSLVGDYYRAWNAQQAELEGDDDLVHQQEIIDMSFLNHRNHRLYQIQKSKFRFPKDYPILLAPPADIPVPMSQIQNETNKNGSIVLVVCESCPKRAIAHFDMSICKSSYDGDRVRVFDMHNTLNFQTKCDHHIKFINIYVPCFLHSPGTVLEDILVPLSDTEICDEKIIFIMQCVVEAAKNVDSDTQLEVLGTDNFRLLYCGVDIDFTPQYFVDLHNRLVILLQLALKYIHHGINVPINDDTKQLIGVSILPSPKRKRLK